MEVRFHVGQKVSLGINNSDVRIDLSLVGWEEGGFIIGKCLSLKEIRLTSKDNCIIRFVKEGVAFGFQTSLLSLQYNPVPLLFFKYPTDIKSMSFRKAARVKTNIPAKLMIRKGNNEFVTDDARVCDVSETGCLIEVPSQKFDDKISLTQCYVTFILLDKNLEFDCVVKNVRKRDDYYYLGSEFNNCLSETQKILSSFIYMFGSSGTPPAAEGPDKEGEGIEAAV